MNISSKINLSDDDDDIDSANTSWLNSSINDSKKLKNNVSDENLSDSDNEVVHKKQKINETSFNKINNNENKINVSYSKNESVKGDATNTDTFTGLNKYHKMMAKMGFENGKGLGKHGQGIVKPIEESNQKGKRGIGFKSDKGDNIVEQWDYSKDEIGVKEFPEWLFNNDLNVPRLETLISWIRRGKKKLTLDDEDQFCSKEILKEVLLCKSVFDNLENRELIQARTRSNPFESIGAVMFQNRAAMKMANIDNVFNNMFTDPKDSLGRSKIEDNEPLYFVDICAGPGGFSEYVLWRKKGKSKGFGMTLKGDNDFNLDEFVAGAPEFFEPYYGVNGIHGDGDITNPDNLKEFEKFVLASTNEKGVHFVMADGGFSVEGNENIQEILSKQLYLCQFLCALSVLRIGGNFVCKLFDLFTPFSCGLIYLLYLCFDRISLHKPITSRPANSERYIICENMKECKTIIQEYFVKINEELWAIAKSKIDTDIRSIVDIDVIKNDNEFFRYFKNSNEKMGKVQILNLKKIKAFASNPNLFDQRQEQVREECLKQWNIPDLPRVGGKNKKHGFKRKFHQQNRQIQINPDETFNKLNAEIKNSIIKIDILSMFTNKLKELNSNHLDENFRKSSIFDFRCMLSCGELVLLLGCGRSNVFEYNFQNPQPNGNSRWKKLTDWNIELPRDTLLLAEKVCEYRGVDKGQINLQSIHIVDALFLDGANLLIQNDKINSFNDRLKNLKILELIINKKSRPELNLIRVKDLIRFEELNSVFNCLSYKKHKKNFPGNKLGIHIPLNNPLDFYVYPNGIYMFKFVNSPWSVTLSKRDNRKYFFNYKTGESKYGAPSDSSFCSSPKVYWDDGYFWKWTSETRIEESEFDDENETSCNKNPLLVTKQQILKFISSKL